MLNNVQLVSLYAYRLRSVDKRHREAATNVQNGTVNAVQLNIAFDKKKKRINKDGHVKMVDITGHHHNSSLLQLDVQIQLF